MIDLPTMKETAQKNACTRYNRHWMASCRIGVTSPTSQLKVQLAAVDRLAPLARMLMGKISGGYNQGIGPHEKPNAAL
jgi:hypothetical protein